MLPRARVWSDHRHVNELALYHAGIVGSPSRRFYHQLLTVYLCIARACGQTVPTTNLILAGVAVSSFATSLTSFLMLRSTSEVRRAIGWFLGGVSLVGWNAILAIIPYLAIGLGVWFSAVMP